MELTVWVDGWQLQCCGEPFAVGSRVSWTLAPAPREGAAVLLGDTVTVDGAEEHHGGVPDDAPVTAGTVTGISAATRPLSGSGEAAGPLAIQRVRRADGRERAGEFLAGYLVRLRT